ncbi:EHD1 [Symbiodinium sp. CCMP2592]|nr:EHD1 [Symbiodinium sp. CCMP2592]
MAVAADERMTDDTSRTVVQRLKSLYMDLLRPIEVDSFFLHFNSESTLTVSELEARPQVLLIGQYSTGKTSLIKWVTGIESPFFDIRPQPSTDKFMAVVHGDEEKVINGDAATCLPDLPYSGLSRFGSSFLGKFQVLVESADILKQITFIDTPGVLSGDKQRISRGYDFMKVCRWLAARSDLILLLFDAHKLDISDEFKEVIESIRSDGDKCRCVLNKADEIDGENLVKVYGALMWNLGKILQTPEVARMYVGSFWDEDYKCKDLERLLNQDRKDLLQELRDLPRNVCVRRVNEIVARARAVKVHLALCCALRARLPAFGFCGRRHRHQLWLSEHLPEVYAEVMKDYEFAPGDMPHVEYFGQRLRAFKDFRAFQRSCKAQQETLDRLIATEIPRLMAMVGGISASELGQKVNGKSSGFTWNSSVTRPSSGDSGRSGCLCLCLLLFLSLALFPLAAVVFVGQAEALAALDQLVDLAANFSGNWTGNLNALPWTKQLLRDFTGEEL